LTKETAQLVSASREAPIENVRGRDARDAGEPAARDSRLKVLHILDHSLPLHSGYTFRSQSILEAQRNRNWAAVALTSPKHEANWKKPSPPEEEIGGSRYYRSGSLPAGGFPFKNEYRLMKRLAARIEQVARIERPGLLHAHSPVLNALPAIWVGRELGIPVVYEIRAFWEDAAVDHGTYAEGSLKYKIVRSAETWACRHAAQVAVLCNGLKQDLVRRGIPDEKLTAVFNGINPQDFHSCAPDLEFARSLGITGKKIIGFIGSFYRYEGLDLLVQTAAKLTATRDDFVLLLVGGGEMEKELRGQIEQLGLQGKVIMPGRISHERIPGIYSLVDILAYPRYSMRLTELVTPLKPLEAMAMGKPVVASGVGGHRELIQDGTTGLLFKAGDIAALAEALECLLDEPELRAGLAAQGNAWVLQNHTWEKTTAVYSAIYSKALALIPK